MLDINVRVRLGCHYYHKRKLIFLGKIRKKFKTENNQKLIMFVCFKLTCWHETLLNI